MILPLEVTPSRRPHNLQPNDVIHAHLIRVDHVHPVPGDQLHRHAGKPVRYLRLPEVAAFAVEDFNSHHSVPEVAADP